MLNIPRYGSGHARDWWAKRIATTYTELVKGSRTPNGFNAIPGSLTRRCVQARRGLGRYPQRSPRRRRNFAQRRPRPRFFANMALPPPLPKPLTPSPRFSPVGHDATSSRIHSHLLAEEGGVEALETLIRSHNAMGGTLINLKVVVRI